MSGRRLTPGGVPLRTIVVTAAVVATAYLADKLVYKLREVILLIVVAGFIALLLDPAVVHLQRLGIKHRGGAVAIVTLVAVVAFGGLAFVFGYPLVNGITHLAENLPKYVTQAEHGKGWIGKLVRKYHIQHWVAKNAAPKLASFAKDLSKPALTLGKGAVSILFSLFAIFMLVLLLLLEAPKIKSGFLRFLLPTVLFAFAHSLTAGIVVLVVFLVYTQVENHILNPVVMSRTVHINPLLVLLAILVGANVGDLVGGFFGGFVGTLLAIPVAGAIQVIVREVWRVTAPEGEPSPAAA